MKYRLFLLDLDDTLLDFQASEREAFARLLRHLGHDGPLEAMYRDYQAINQSLWRQFEQGAVAKEVLKVERFRATFAMHAPGLDAVAASEHYLDFYRRQHGLEPVVFRFFNVYGPRQDPSSPYSGVISIFADRVRAGQEIGIQGDGLQTRDFIFVAGFMAAWKPGDLGGIAPEAKPAQASDAVATCPSVIRNRIRRPSFM